MEKVIGAVLLITLTIPVAAQEKGFYAEKIVYVNPRDPDKRVSLDIADALFWSGFTADTASSWNKYERGIFRNEQGKFAAGPAIAANIGWWGFAKWLQYKFPKHRRIGFWLVFAAGSLHWGATAYNLRQ